MAIVTWHMNWFFARLGLPSLSKFFSLPAQNECFNLLVTMISTWMYYFHWFFLDFHVVLPKRPVQIQYKSTANMLVVLVPPAPAGVCQPVHGCQPVRTRRNQVSTHITPFAIYHRKYHTLLYTTTNITPCYHTFLLPYHTFFLVYHRNLRCIAQKSTI